MFNKSALFCALFVVFGFTLQLAIATPPACFLACVNKQPKLDDYKAICQSKVTDMFGCFKSMCDSGGYGDAVNSYKASCKDEGFNVETPTSLPTSSNSSEPSTTPTDAATDTATDTTTPINVNGSSIASPTPSGSGSPNGNGASASTAYYNSMLALIAVFAAAAVVL